MLDDVPDEQDTSAVYLTAVTLQRLPRLTSDKHNKNPGNVMNFFT